MVSFPSELDKKVVHSSWPHIIIFHFTSNHNNNAEKKMIRDYFYNGGWGLPI